MGPLTCTLVQYVQHLKKKKKPKLQELNILRENNTTASPPLGLTGMWYVGILATTVEDKKKKEQRQLKDYHGRSESHLL